MSFNEKEGKKGKRLKGRKFQDPWFYAVDLNLMHYAT